MNMLSTSTPDGILKVMICYEYVMIAYDFMILYASLIIHDAAGNLLGLGLHGLATKFVQGLGDHRSEGRAADSNGLEQWWGWL